MYELIKDGTYSLSDSIWDLISAEAKDLVTRLLVVDQDKRITRDQLREHPWLNGQFKASSEILPIGK